MPGPVAILIPTMRAHLIPALIENIAATTALPYKVYWAATKGSICAEVLKVHKQKVLLDKGDFWPGRINALFKWTTEPFVFLGADDVLFHENWLEQAFIGMEKVEGVGVVSVKDLLNVNGTLSLIAREYIDTYGGTMDRSGPVIHPGYHHNWSETELYQTAQHRGRFVYCEEAIVEHRHHNNGKAPFDEVYALGQSFWDQDVAIFFSRHPMWM